MNVLMVIPARSGSRRLPNKNVMPLGGISLIGWSVKAAMEAIDTLIGEGIADDAKVIVSTDSLDYQKCVIYEYQKFMSESLGLPVQQLTSQEEICPFLRDESISGDVDTGLVIQDAYRYMRDKREFDADIVVTLQPTSPFRSSKDIVECVRPLVKHEVYDGVFSVKRVKEFPQWMFTQGYLQIAQSWLGFPQRLLSGLIAQDLPVLYIPNGAVYASRREIVADAKIYGESMMIYEMPELRSLDIEEQIDLDYAKYIVEKKLLEK